MPTELDVVTRRMRQLEIEQVALSPRDRRRLRERLAKLDEELANLKEQSDAAQRVAGSPRRRLSRKSGAEGRARDAGGGRSGAVRP